MDAMNVFCKWVGVGALLLGWTASGWAGENIRFKADRKRLEVDRDRKSIEMKTAEKWIYSVELQNAAFKDFANLEVQYAVFGSQETLGAKDAPARDITVTGAKTIPELKNNGRFAFDTEPLSLEKAQLGGGYYYPSGGDAKARAAVNGIWVRVFKDGEMIAEYASPSTLSKTREWPSGAEPGRERSKPKQ
jgi:hypothetical protein